MKLEVGQLVKVTGHIRTHRDIDGKEGFVKSVEEGCNYPYLVEFPGEGALWLPAASVTPISALVVLAREA